MTDAPTTGPVVEAPKDADAGEQTVVEKEAPTFNSHKEFQDFMDKKIQERVARVEKKYAPVVEERDKLKTTVDEWTPVIDATKTDAQRWETEKASYDEELNALRAFKADSERMNLVRQLAEDKGLPARLVSRVQGDDADSITADIDSLLEDLAESGQKISGFKPQPREQQQKQKLSPGGGEESEDELLDLAKAAEQIHARNSGFFV